MPIYAYRCADCGHSKDVLQKLSDAPLTACPACGGSGFAKQLTAAGFQLKGSGWYVTDFKGGASGAKSTGGAKDAPSDAKTGEAGSDAKSSASAEGSGPGCGASCACH